MSPASPAGLTPVTVVETATAAAAVTECSYRTIQCAMLYSYRQVTYCAELNVVSRRVMVLLESRLADG